MSMKNSNDNIGNRTRDLPACSAVPQSTAPPRAPNSIIVNSIIVKIVLIKHNDNNSEGKNNNNNKHYNDNSEYNNNNKRGYL
jgi:hypothetical protein